MTHHQPICAVADRVVSALAARLGIEFGRGTGEALAHRFRGGGCRVSLECEGRGALDRDLRSQRRGRIRARLGAVLGRLDGDWFVAVVIIDGYGNAHGMMGLRNFRRLRDAIRAFADA